MILYKHLKPNWKFILSLKRGALGKTGEPFNRHCWLGQRACNTSSLERDLVTGKHWKLSANGKEPKSMGVFKKVFIANSSCANQAALGAQDRNYTKATQQSSIPIPHSRSFSTRSMDRGRRSVKQANAARAALCTPFGRLFHGETSERSERRASERSPAPFGRGARCARLFYPSVACCTVSSLVSPSGKQPTVKQTTEASAGAPVSVSKLDNLRRSSTRVSKRPNAERSPLNVACMFTLLNNLDIWITAYNTLTLRTKTLRNIHGHTNTKSVYASKRSGKYYASQTTSLYKQAASFNTTHTQNTVVLCLKTLRDAVIQQTYLCSVKPKRHLKTTPQASCLFSCPPSTERPTHTESLQPSDFVASTIPEYTQYCSKNGLSIRPPMAACQPSCTLLLWQHTLVQQVIQLTLETMLKPRLPESSHAFRADRSQHTCLRQIQQQFSNTNWYIIGDTSNCFAQMNHEKCVHLLGNSIKDTQFLNLIKQSLHNNSEANSNRSTKQATHGEKSDLSKRSACLSAELPLVGLRAFLENAILYELDMFVLQLQSIAAQYGLERFSATSLDFSKLLGFEHNTIQCKTQNSSSLHRASFQYVRFAHHFLLGVTGSKQNVTVIYDLLSRFLQTRLELLLQIDTLQIQYAKVDKVPFLGYLLHHSAPLPNIQINRQRNTFTRFSGINKKQSSQRPQSFSIRTAQLTHFQLHKYRMKTHLSYERATHLRQTSQCMYLQKRNARNNSLYVRNGYSVEQKNHVSTIRLLVNMPKVIHSLAEKGFCDRSGNPKPNFRYFQDSQTNTVARAASILRGLANYYHLSDSRRRCVSRWSYIFTHSLAMMFAAKFKLGTRAKVFALAGRNLSKPLLARKRKYRGNTTGQ